jgi:hypothetical protein
MGDVRSAIAIGYGRSAILDRPIGDRDRAPAVLIARELDCSIGNRSPIANGRSRSPIADRR